MEDHLDKNHDDAAAGQDESPQELQQGTGMTTKGSNNDLKKIIYRITVGMTSVLIAVGSYLYVEMKRDVDDINKWRVAIEVHNQANIEIIRRVTALETWAADHERKSAQKIEEYSQQIAVLMANVTAINKALDIVQQTQAEILKSIQTMAIENAKREPK